MVRWVHSSSGWLVVWGIEPGRLVSLSSNGFQGLGTAWQSAKAAFRAAEPLDANAARRLRTKGCAVDNSGGTMRDQLRSLRDRVGVARFTLMGLLVLCACTEVASATAGGDATHGRAGTMGAQVWAGRHAGNAGDHVRLSPQELAALRRRAGRVRSQAAARARARRVWLASPKQRARRHASRRAYRGLTAPAGRQLLVHEFGATLRRLGASPASVLAAKGHVLRYQGGHRAIVATTGGRKLIAYSVLPMRTDGGPVELRLDQSAAGFAPVRSAARVSIASESSGGVSMAPGVRFVLEGADSLGAISASNSVFFSSVGTDMDAAVTPTSSGVDLSTVLRSPASPEQIRYRVDLPGGTDLRALDGGAAVYRGPRLLISIPAPVGTDAQGSSVPITMAVVGNELVLSVRHRGLSVAYPLLVDPLVQYLPLYDTQGWSFTNCTGNGNITAPAPGEIALAGGSYSKDDCGEWVWSGAAAGVPPGGIYQVVDDVGVSDDPSGNRAETGPFLWGTTPPGLVWDRGQSGPKCYDDIYNRYGYTDDEYSQGTQAAVCGSNFFFGFNVDVFGEIDHPGSAFTESTAVTGGVGYLMIYSEDPSGMSTPPEQYGPNNPGEPNQTRACSGDPVDCATGNFYESETDLSLPARGVPFALTRTYNSQDAAAGQSGPFGFGWSSSFGDHLVIDTPGQTLTVVQANGSEVPFSTASGSPLPADPLTEATLRENPDGSYTYMLPNQSSEQFDAAGQLLSESDRYGNSLSDTYNSSGELTEVADGAGRTITLAYAPDGSGHVVQATGPTGSVSYAYDSNGNLTQVTDLDGGTWKFAYDASHQMTSATAPLGNALTNSYDSSNRVIAQTDGTGRTTTWGYPATGETVITNPAGDVTDETFNSAGLPTTTTRGYGTSTASTETIGYNDSWTRSRPPTAMGTAGATPTTRRTTRQARPIPSDTRRTGRTTRRTTSRR